MTGLTMVQSSRSWASPGVATASVPVSRLATSTATASRTWPLECRARTAAVGRTSARSTSSTAHQNRLNAVRNQLWYQETIFGNAVTPYYGSTSEPGDQFGLALAAGDFDGDGRADLAVGVPLEDVLVDTGTSLVTVPDAGEADVISTGPPRAFPSRLGLRRTSTKPRSTSRATPGRATPVRLQPYRGELRDATGSTDRSRRRCVTTTSPLASRTKTFPACSTLVR